MRRERNYAAHRHTPFDTRLRSAPALLGVLKAATMGDMLPARSYDNERLYNHSSTETRPAQA
ncbi:MAG: hypothetical protein OHK0015_20710 [Chloroflexi bacterium OHK40]